MKVFALGDLHLDAGQNKPMDVFGTRWQNHSERIFASWRELIAEGDCVLIPGDFCWAMQLKDALDELGAVGELPGRKVLVRGNHDYWWSSPTKLRESVPPGISIIQNDAADMSAFIVCGSRGWTLPGTAEHTQKDEKIYNRELLRLDMSLAVAKRLKAASDMEKPIIAMLHYPPVYESGEGSGFTELFERYGVNEVVYGHLHAQSCIQAFEGEKNGIRYTLCSADHLGFSPKLIAEYGEKESEQ